MGYHVYHEFPYTDLHSINLDYLINEVEALKSVVSGDNIAEMVEDGRIGATIQRFIRNGIGDISATGYHVFNVPMDDVTYANNGANFYSLVDQDIVLAEDGLYDVAYGIALGATGADADNPNMFNIVITHNDHEISTLATFGHEANDSQGAEMVRYMYAGDKIRLSARVYGRYEWKELTNAQFPTYVRITRIL